MSPDPLSPSPPLPCPRSPSAPAHRAGCLKGGFQYCAEARFNVSRSPEILNYSLGTNGLFAEESQVVPELLSGWTCWWFKRSAGQEAGSPGPQLKVHAMFHIIDITKYI